MRSILYMAALLLACSGTEADDGPVPGEPCEQIRDCLFANCDEVNPMDPVGCAEFHCSDPPANLPLSCMPEWEAVFDAEVEYWAGGPHYRCPEVEPALQVCAEG